MKKYVIGILLSVLVFSVIALSGCSTSIELFKIGTYEADEIEGEPFTKVKFIIQPITQEEYESANGVNVIKNNSSNKENNIYYSFELFFYDNKQESYIQAKISNIKQPIAEPTNNYNGDIESNYVVGSDTFYLNYEQTVSQLFYFDLAEPHTAHRFNLRFVS